MLPLCTTLPSLLVGRPPLRLARPLSACSIDDAGSVRRLPHDDVTYKPQPPAELPVGEIAACQVLGPAPGKSYYVDIGTPQPALLPAAEVCLLPNVTGQGDYSRPGQGWRQLEIGSVYEAQVISVSGDEINVSLAGAQRSAAWGRIKQLEDNDVAYNATVLRVSDAGATLAVEHLPAFVPWSHWHLPEGDARTPESLIGSSLSVKFLEVDPQEGRLLASHRRVQLQQRLAELSPGQVVSGTVAALKQYGAVVRLSDDRLEGLDGLLHISQISKAYVQDVSAVFAVGDKVRCVVIKVDASDGSISLSTKRLEQRAGDMLARNQSALPVA